MEQLCKPNIILLADDDPDDCMMVKEASEISGLAIELRSVKDGEELLAYLYHCGRYAGPATSPRPRLILLDLNMPKMNGREALRVIKGDHDLCIIPVVILTTSRTEEQIRWCYRLGASSYIAKPVTFESLVGVLQGLSDYWFQLVELPDNTAKSVLGGCDAQQVDERACY